MQNIVTLGEINDALKIAAVTAAQLEDMGFAALANKPICEGLPPEESRRLRNAKLYPAESIGQIRVALAQRLAAPASVQAISPTFAVHAGDSKVTLHFSSEAEALEFYRTAKFDAGIPGNKTPQAAPAAVAVPDERWCPDVCPITGRRFFGWIEHWKTGKDIPTYGGPFDSYTLPVKDEDGTFSCERFDHDAGEWMTEGMGWCDLGLMLADDQAFVVQPENPRYDEIRDFAEGRAALAATPAADAKQAEFEAIRMFWAQHGSQKVLSMDTLAELHSDVECTIRQQAAAAAPVVLPKPEAVVSEVMELVKDWAQRDLIAGEAGIDALSEESSEKQHQEAKRLDGEAEAAYRAIEAKLRALLAGVSAPAAPTEQQILDAAEKAGLWPNTVQSWIPAFKRYHAALAAAPQAQADARDAESDYQRGYRHGYNRRDAEVQGALL